MGIPILWVTTIGDGLLLQSVTYVSHRWGASICRLWFVISDVIRVMDAMSVTIGFYCLSLLDLFYIVLKKCLLLTSLTIQICFFSRWLACNVVRKYLLMRFSWVSNLLADTMLELFGILADMFLFVYWYILFLYQL